MVSKATFKHLLKLAGESAYRKQHNSIIASGHHCFKELTTEPLGVWVTEKYLSRHEAPSAYELISAIQLQRITKEAEPEGILFTCQHPQNYYGHVCPEYRKTLVLYRLADPRNVGSLARTALALGWHQVVLLGDQATDPYSLLCIRCSKGAILKLPRIVSTPMLEQAELDRYQVVLAEAGKFSKIEANPIMLFLGSESHGFDVLPDALKKRAISIGINTDPGMPCLNVHAAGAILMHKLSQT